MEDWAGWCGGDTQSVPVPGNNGTVVPVLSASLRWPQTAPSWADRETSPPSRQTYGKTYDHGWDWVNQRETP